MIYWLLSHLHRLNNNNKHLLLLSLWSPFYCNIGKDIHLPACEPYLQKHYYDSLFGTISINMSGVWGVGTILIVLFSKNSSLSLTGSVEKLRFPLNVLFCFSGKPPPLTKIFAWLNEFYGKMLSVTSHLTLDLRGLTNQEIQ